MEISFNEQELAVSQKTKGGYIEEYIIIERIDELLKYSLSNDFKEIEKAVYERTGCTLYNDSLGWTRNKGLSENVKASMNKYNVNYSMTTYPEGKYNNLVINMRDEDDWYIRSFVNLTDTYYTWEFLRYCTDIEEAIKLILAAKNEQE